MEQIQDSLLQTQVAMIRKLRATIAQSWTRFQNKHLFDLSVNEADCLENPNKQQLLQQDGWRDIPLTRAMKNKWSEHVEDGYNELRDELEEFKEELRTNCLSVVQLAKDITQQTSNVSNFHLFYIGLNKFDLNFHLFYMTVK